MAGKKYDPKLFYDEALQYPPESVIEKGKPSKISPGADVLVTVERVEGACSEHQIEGDEHLYSGFECVSGEEGVCPFAEFEMWPYISGMSQGVSAKDMGIAYDGEDGFVCCGAWGCPSVEAKIVYRLHPIPYEQTDSSFIDFIYEYLAKGDHFSAPKHFRQLYSKEEVLKERDDLVKEWDEAGRPLFWDKWRDCNRLYNMQKEWRAQGIPDAEAIEKVLGRKSRL